MMRNSQRLIKRHAIAAAQARRNFECFGNRFLPSMDLVNGDAEAAGSGTTFLIGRAVLRLSDDVSLARAAGIRRRASGKLLSPELR